MSQLGPQIHSTKGSNRIDHIKENGIIGKVDVSEMMGSSVHLYVNFLTRDVIMVVSTRNITDVEIATLANSLLVTFNYADHVCHIFNKEPDINLEAKHNNELII